MKISRAPSLPARPARPFRKRRAETEPRQLRQYVGRSGSCRPDRWSASRGRSSTAGRFSTRIVVGSSFCKLIADAVYREHVPGIARIRFELAAQVFHVYVNGAIKRFGFQAPDCVQQLSAREDTPRLAGQRGQQLELRWSHLDAAILRRDLHDAIRGLEAE